MNVIHRSQSVSNYHWDMGRNFRGFSIQSGETEGRRNRKTWKNYVYVEFPLETFVEIRVSLDIEGSSPSPIQNCPTKSSPRYSKPITNSLVVLEPRLVACKTENTETNRATTGENENEARLNTSNRRGERPQAQNTQEVSDRVSEQCSYECAQTRKKRDSACLQLVVQECSCQLLVRVQSDPHNRIRG